MPDNFRKPDVELARLFDSNRTNFRYEDCCETDEKRLRDAEACYRGLCGSRQVSIGRLLRRVCGEVSDRDTFAAWVRYKLRMKPRTAIRWMSLAYFADELPANLADIPASSLEALRRPQCRDLLTELVAAAEAGNPPSPADVRARIKLRRRSAKAKSGGTDLVADNLRRELRTAILPGAYDRLLRALGACVECDIARGVFAEQLRADLLGAEETSSMEGPGEKVILPFKRPGSTEDNSQPPTN